MGRISVNTSRLKSEVANVSRGALLRIAEDILTEAKQMVVQPPRTAAHPYTTGELRDSGHIEEDGATGEIRVIFDAPHASYVEFGTSKMRAQPFLTPAAFKTRKIL